MESQSYAIYPYYLPSLTSQAISPGRHDDPEEQEHDRIRTEICDSHRFKSFADVRDEAAVKWYA